MLQRRDPVLGKRHTAGEQREGGPCRPLALQRRPSPRDTLTHRTVACRARLDIEGSAGVESAAVLDGDSERSTCRSSGRGDGSARPPGALLTAPAPPPPPTAAITTSPATERPNREVRDRRCRRVATIRKSSSMDRAAAVLGASCVERPRVRWSSACCRGGPRPRMKPYEKPTPSERLDNGQQNDQFVPNSPVELRPKRPPFAVLSSGLKTHEPSGDARFRALAQRQGLDAQSSRASLDDPELCPGRWTIETTGGCLAARGDLFGSVLGEDQELPQR